jgi:hypothetical protein
LRIHSRTLYNARAGCKMVCEAVKGKLLPAISNHSELRK